MSKPNSKSAEVLTRLFITMIGVAFVLWGLSTIALGFFGIKETAVITDIRRELGERNEVMPGRYTYYISYTFTLPNGNKIDGFSRKIGSAIYLKADGKSKTTIRYFSFFPSVNALEKDAKPGWGQLILIAIGCFLIVIINRSKKITLRKMKFNDV
jgi:hypothetical protein